MFSYSQNMFIPWKFCSKTNFFKNKTWIAFLTQTYTYKPDSKPALLFGGQKQNKPKLFLVCILLCLLVYCTFFIWLKYERLNKSLLNSWEEKKRWWTVKFLDIHAEILRDRHEKLENPPSYSMNVPNSQCINPYWCWYDKVLYKYIILYEFRSTYIHTHC